jgi:DNA invertase Pin-like site-specific DNA recombinase
LGEREPANGKGLGRPGLDYALERIYVRQDAGLVVTELSRLTRSASDLGAIIQRLDDCEARLIR